MHATHLSALNYRNYEQVDLTLSEGPQLFIGKNGQGKTNLLEAINYLATLRSHRVHGDEPLIKRGQDKADLRLKVKAGARDVLLGVQIEKNRPKKASINTVTVKPRDLSNWFSTVLFAPEDLGLIKAEPARRRRFMNDALTARLPAAASTIADYEKALKGRAALLKSARGGFARSDSSFRATIEVWDEQLVGLGVKILSARRSLLEDMQKPFAQAYMDLVKEDHAPLLGLEESLGTDRDVSRETFHEALEASLVRDVERGATSVGPHRDDLFVGLHGLPARGYASHGESWSLALALKLALACVLRENSPGGDPVLLLDDVFAELDGNRRARLMGAVKEYEQVIVTAAVEGDVPTDVSWRKTRIESGKLLRGEVAE